MVIGPIARPARQDLRARPVRSWTSSAVVAILVAIGSLAVAPTGALAATAVWTVTASPATLIEGQATTVTLTVTVLSDGPIGTVLVSIPAGFTVTGASAPSPWLWAITQVGPPALVQFNVTTDSQRLSPVSSVNLAITVIATSSPLGSWTVTSYQKFDTTSTQNAPPTTPLAPFLIVPSPTPSPAPSPTPTPLPTLPPLPTPLPTLPPLPTLLSSPTPTATGTPAMSATASPTAAPTALSSSGPSASPSPPDASGSPTPPASPASTPSPSPPGSVVLDVGSTTSGGSSTGTVGFGSLGPLDFAFDWLIPGFAVAVPGLLVVFLVLVQAVAGTVWLPLVRRELGDFGLLERRKRTSPPRA